MRREMNIGMHSELYCETFGAMPGKCVREHLAKYTIKRALESAKSTICREIGMAESAQFSPRTTAEATTFEPLRRSIRCDML